MLAFHFAKFHHHKSGGILPHAGEMEMLLLCKYSAKKENNKEELIKCICLFKSDGSEASCFSFCTAR